MPLESVNPANGKVMQVFEEWSATETDRVIEEVHGSWPVWRDSAFTERAALMRKAAEVLRLHAGEYAEMMALEMGKPLAQGRAEVEKCAWACEYYADHAADYLAEEPAESDGSRALVAFRPLGLVLAVMPWNFPFWQVFRCAAPALMAGNVLVLKHSSNVPRCALAIEDVFRKAGFPEQTFRTLLIGARKVEGVIENRRVRAVALTGSDAAGRQVAAAAGRMLKKTVLELGGSDPFIVLADADLAEAARVGALARCINSGQSCIAAKRFLVEESVYSHFLELLVREMAALVVGDPLDEVTQVGPLARRDLVVDLNGQVGDAVKHGAETILGGRPLESIGCYYPPTILTGVKPGMRAYHEELFGPVATVMAVCDIEQALAVANDTPFGLGASIWTADLSKGADMAARIESGAVFVNGMVKSDPRLPFGGVKDSGYGRELAGFGIREFVNVQTIWIG
ncbi:MAG: NAD-dependent succinate-semialdehyde dehydrogenase [Geobacteraceae bacterium]